METLKLEVDSNGIAVVTFDVPGRSMNTLTSQVQKDIGELATILKTDEKIKGFVMISGKMTGFCAGADLGEMGEATGGKPGSPDDIKKAMFDKHMVLIRAMRDFETSGKPFACCINGHALGGGLELALLAHYRVATDDPKIQIGLPESTIGLLPGGGGTQRLPRMIGIEASLRMMLEGKPVKPVEALKMGLVNEIVPRGKEVEAAKKWLSTNPEGVQPWDKKDYKGPPGGLPYKSPVATGTLVQGAGLLMKKTFGNFPAQMNIMKCVYEGIQVPLDAGLRIEGRYFIETMLTSQAKAMIRTNFLSMQELNRGVARPKDVPPLDVKKVGVLGAGMMGAGIAYVSAAAGLETILIDMSQEAADKGKAYSQGVVDKAVERGQMTREKGDALLSLITATTDYKHLEGAQLVVEAVFESRDVKKGVTEKAEAVLPETAIFASNTSTLPITGLAQNSKRPDQFIGLHVFSPVDRMGLVEVILGEKTSQKTIAHALDYVKKIRKTAILAKDARGFYTSRAFDTYIREGMEMLAEGIAPAIIDNVGRATSMPRGPLELLDDVAIDLVGKIMDQTRADLGDKAGPLRASDKIVNKMVELGRYGRKTNKGFYDYAGKSKTLWPELAKLWPVKISHASPELIEEIKQRLLYRQAVEAARCMEEGVLADPRFADVGAILGWGFANWTGGPLSLIDAVGLPEFVATCDKFAQLYGDRFAPPKLLRDMAANGKTFYKDSKPSKAKAA